MSRLIYIAGPFSPDPADPTPEEQQIKLHIARANACGQQVAILGSDLFPIIPHNNCREDWVNIREYQYFIDGTKKLLYCCQAMLVIPGSRFDKSNGTLGEITEASLLGIPVFFSVEALAKWAAENTY